MVLGWQTVNKNHT